MESSTLRFPQSFILKKTSLSDRLLYAATPGKDDENLDQPLYYIATHNSWSSQPDVVLHSGPSSNSPPLSTATFKRFSSTITLSSDSESSEMFRGGVFTKIHSFAVMVPQTGQKEMFEWKRSSGNDVASLGVRSSGLKLVRASTREVVMVYARNSMSLSKKGKVAFVGSGAQGQLGGNWDTMAVISLLAVQEKLRRTKSSSSGSGGAGAGGC